MNLSRELLKGQNALVTGANSGIGEATARALAAAGATVVVNYVTHAPAAEKVVNDLKAAGGQAIAIQADVSDETQVEAMFAEVFKQLGTIDILVNNAGVQRDAALVDMTLEQWNAVLGVNLTGQFLCARAAARVHSPRSPTQDFPCGGQDHLHEFGASDDSLGRPRELRHVQGRYHAIDEEHCPGIGASQDSGQQHRPRRHRDAHQSLGLGFAGGEVKASETHPLWPRRIARRHCQGRCLACVGRVRLRSRDDLIRGWRHDAVSRLCHRRMIRTPRPSGPAMNMWTSASLRVVFVSLSIPAGASAVVLGYAILRSSSALRTIWETIKRAFSLSSAGTTYQGAWRVLVAFRQASKAFM